MLALLAQVTDDYSDTVSTGDTAAATGIIAGFGIFFLVLIVIGLAFWVFNLWMAIDCATRSESDFPSNNKNMWLILLIVGLLVGFGWIVALVYYFTVKKKANGGSATTTQAPPAEEPKQ